MLSKTYLYSIDIDTWMEGASMITPRVGAACCEIKDDDGQTTKILVAGGYSGTEKLKTTEIYDLSQETWTSGPAIDSRIHNSRLVTAPFGSSYAAYILTGLRDTNNQKDINGISKDLSRWTKLGSIERERTATTVIMVDKNLIGGC